MASQLLKQEPRSKGNQESHDFGVFCDPSLLHAGAFAYKPGPVGVAYIAGKYVLACSSRAQDVFRPALKALGQSKSPLTINVHLRRLHGEYSRPCSET